MSNGHVEIHDLLANHSDPGSQPSSPGDSMEDTVEFRIMMTYAQRRRPKTQASPHKNGGPAANGDANVPSSTPEQTEEKTKTPKKKKKKGWKRLPSIFRCVKPQTEDADDQEREAEDKPEDKPAAEVRLLSPAAQDAEDEVTPEDALGGVVSRLTEIMEDVPFRPPDLESDAPGDKNSQEVEKIIGLMLRTTGDRYAQELEDANISAALFLDYGFYRTLINALLTRMGLWSADPDAPGPHASPKTQIAVACEATSRLSALETLPANRLLDHGARYLQDNFSPWIRQQGGYETAFQEDDEDEVE